MDMPDIEKLLAKAAKDEERKQKALEINPFGTGLKVVKPADDVELKQISGIVEEEGGYIK
jgi:hypothetical protein